MAPFDISSLLARRASQSDEGAIVRMSQRARELRAKGQDIASLTIGEPDFDTPAHIQAAAAEAMRKGLTHYSPVTGILELRQALAKKLKDENGLDYAANEIVIANGAKQAIANAVLALVEPGDEVILLSPYWVSYEITVRLAGGVPIILKADVDEDFKAPPARIAAALTERTKLLILNSPSNPTGAVWSRPELEALAEVVKSHPRLMVLSDEIYEYILFDGKMTSFASLPGMRERSITVNGFSKSFAMTGWRLGYAAGPAPLAVAMARLQSGITAGANSFVQHAALTALSAPRDDVEKMRARYEIRRDMVVKALTAIPGLRLAPIPATFYAFPDVGAFLGRKAGNHVMDSVDTLCDWLLEEHGVATVPGSAFGDPSCIRLSFATGEAELEKALARFAEGLNRLSA
ncbi:pyridoxal phosphate-dependent aminotransferase [Aestuariivirga sp. YIM B02566]|uniref:Pyridoxal phosphate-dependent aminotransferase n=1 Tax=Taklimakanibacter albus TaxID=2800327 RepID=A0ACC5QXR8_9HYPH|nr:pyridoxal phosphate-dependent aminotransferase [Aestuariivirga sp. YIM B02566]MBK1865190.1 pyridoxal phosphate-dependent aminotransferase [Aestuariivirga sp. YIM B02566]